MRTFLALTVTLLAICHAIGCTKNAAPPSTPRPTAAPQPQSSSAETNAAGTSDKDASSSPDADQPDDPGMTTQHDKTIKQEEPSGDESSGAAPNDGDAEPPQ
jgi:hypothetical protein